MPDRQEGIGLYDVQSVNYHLWKPCNMECGFCFARFEELQSLLPKGHLPKDDAIAVVRALGDSGRFRKINFAGGEPMLCPWLPDLVQTAKEHGFTTGVVTNGSRLTPQLLDDMADSLDWLTLSIDSVHSEILQKIGRRERGKPPMSEEQYAALGVLVRERNIRLKVNTVVNRYNVHECLVPFILNIKPERWKLLQALPVTRQNDGDFGQYAITDAEFSAYVERNQAVEASGIKVVPESNELMTGSYVMVDPAGRFFDNMSGSHTYSTPILEVGTETALAQVRVDAERFERRGGRYE